MLEYEKKLWQEHRLILGLDEAGRGCPAGPLVVAGVIFPPNYQNPHINDSKKLTPKQRETLYNVIVNDAIAYQVVIFEPEYVDQHNPKQTSRNGMRQIAQNITPQPTFILTDFEQIPNTPIPQENLIKGDAQSITIAAASILAKVTRDRIMLELDKLYPNYGFAKHKGYGTKAHLDAVNAFGKIKGIHRLSYKFGSDTK
ncbi:ribonuclease HII [Mycoplasmopsis columbinasalis]|uniref:Ribonuclease HII n=1 Tax=Mycoplasmopsis columbinasalis TaxID=114880 RepID=A0A449BAX0_9BACT|nr:ribonuclease HII [Mycoplasmopsis columbinasalis]VEU78339.1 ribonuclease HII [Mycoplasmopsis columbinasalis]